MSKKNTRSTAGTVKRAKETLLIHSNTSAGQRQEGFVEAVCPVGEENAVTLAELMQATGLSREALRKEIEHERRQGSLILSRSDAHGGFFRPTPGSVGAAETRKFVRTLRNRANRTLEIAKLAADTVAPTQAEKQRATVQKHRAARADRERHNREMLAALEDIICNPESSQSAKADALRALGKYR